MSIEKAVFLDLASIHPQDLDLSRLRSAADHWQWLETVAAEDIADLIEDAQVVVSNKVLLNAAVLSRSRHLKLICVAATGVNNVDLQAAQQKNITVCNVRAYATPSVVQHVFTLMLSLLTDIARYREDAVNGQWANSKIFCLLDYPIRELQGMTLGIVGFGELGHAVAKIAQYFGMTVLIAKRDAQDKRANRVALCELLPQIDVLSLHCPLTEANHGMIGVHELRLMKHDAILINTARGGLVDEKALLKALQNNEIAGAALDVLEQEPPAAGNLLLAGHLENLIITPHIAWASRQSRQRLVDEVAKNILAYQQGKPRNVV